MLNVDRGSADVPRGSYTDAEGVASEAPVRAWLVSSNRDGVMDRGRGFRQKVTAALVGVLACVALCPSMAAAEVAPHVTTDETNDSCAMCHHTHTASGDAGWAATDSWETTASSLTMATSADSGDTSLCYVCHGVEALGSATQVQWAFLESSRHSLAPSDAPYGPARIVCSSCHDPHGSARVATGVPYPYLLRARTSTGTAVYQAEEYCATCHFEDRALDRWDGLAIYRQTAHFQQLPDPANGTKISCSVCHVAHGSSIAPLITSQITSPAVTTTETISANDRTLCFACHTEVYGTYPGDSGYATTVHGSSDVTVAITGEWPASGASRKVGECQVCHAPMGSADASGNLVPKLAETEGRALCDQCHDGDGPASADVSSTAYPSSAAADLEVLAAITPTPTTAAQGRIAVYGTEPTASAPRDIVGPREYRVTGTIADASCGDIDGDIATETVVALETTAALVVFEPDRLKGLTSATGLGEQAIASSAEFVAVADVIDDVDSRAEVVVVDADLGDLRVYRRNSGWSALALVDGPVSVGSDVTGIATGDLDADGFAEVVVTDAAGPEFVILSDDGAGGIGVDATVSSDVLSGVCGPSIGDVWPSPGVEIVVANSAEAVDTVSIYAADGSFIDHVTVDADLAGGARAVDTLVADVLPDAAGAELAVAVDGAAGTSTVDVFTQTEAGLAALPPHDTGTGYGTGSLASGDIDGDGRRELVVGNGGWWSSVATDDQAPSIMVFNHTVAGDDLANPLTLWSGGVELAGRAPALAVADLGGVGFSRHPVGAVSGAHTSTETPAFTRHVECVDCHDVHEATTAAATAPAVFGQLKGVFGASIQNNGLSADISYGDAQPVALEYQVCFKCHSGYSDLEGGRDIASEVNTRNASVHAVEAAASTVINASTFETGWSQDSVLYCSDCHGNADTSAGAVRGLHRSTEAPLLVRPYLGTRPQEAQLLCYACHKSSVYLTGADDTGDDSLFFDGDLAQPALHSLHVNDHGFGCSTCHVSHGSPTQARLMRADTGCTLDAGGGSCVNGCHPAPGKTYTR
ncbi:MAG: hypothetical protein LLG24_04255 [Actinomycetia bacterium]|nr:hypothetical protein [Actinomycetes bacterium]